MLRAGLQLCKTEFWLVHWENKGVGQYPRDVKEARLRITAVGCDILGLCLQFGDTGAMKGKEDTLVVF